MTTPSGPFDSASSGFSDDFLEPLGELFTSGGIEIDFDTADWVKEELDQMIETAREEIKRSNDFFERAQETDWGQTAAGQAMRAKFIHRSSSDRGGLIWFWTAYRDSLTRFRDVVGDMAVAWQRADEDSADMTGAYLSDARRSSCVHRIHRCAHRRCGLFYRY